MHPTATSLRRALFILLILTTPHLLHAQWNPDPNMNNPVFAGAPCRTPLMRVTDDGILYFWKKYLGPRSGYMLCGQKLSFDGLKQWPWNGNEYAPISETSATGGDFNAVTVDSSTFLAWAQYDSSRWDTIFLQCINGDGIPRWHDPIAISDDPSITGNFFDLNSSCIQLQPHTTASAWIVWSEEDDTLRCRTVGCDSTLGPVTVIDTIAPYAGLKTVSDGRGGFYAFILERQSFPQPLHSTLRMHRIDSSGTLPWPDVVSVFSIPAAILQMDVVRMRDSSLLIAWWEGLEGSTLYQQWARLRVQRVSPAGALIGGANPVVLIDSAYYPGGLQLVAARDSGAFACYQMEYEQRVQRLTCSGTPMWGSKGSIVNDQPGERGRMRGVTTADGGIVLGWEESGIPGTSRYDLYAQRLDADGTVMWARKGMPVSTAQSVQYWLTLHPLGDNVLFCWDDLRPDSSGIYSAFLDIDGGHIPVRLLSFSGDARPEGNVLYWTAEGEEDVHRYIVQRAAGESVDEWHLIGEVASSGMRDRREHRFLDAAPTHDVMQYRLACLHHDGSTVHSPVVEVRRSGPALALTVDMYPNPAAGSVTFSLQTELAGVLTVHDALGREMRRFRVPSGATAIPWDLTDASGLRVSGGWYHVRVSTGDRATTRRLLVQ